MSWEIADEAAMNRPAVVATAAAMPPAATKPTNHDGRPAKLCGQHDENVTGRAGHMPGSP